VPAQKQNASRVNANMATHTPTWVSVRVQKSSDPPDILPDAGLDEGGRWRIRLFRLVETKGKLIWQEPPRGLVQAREARQLGALTSKQTHVSPRGGCSIPVAKTRLITTSGRVELRIGAPLFPVLPLSPAPSQEQHCRVLEGPKLFVLGGQVLVCLCNFAIDMSRHGFKSPAGPISRVQIAKMPSLSQNGKARGRGFVTRMPPGQLFVPRWAP
jgi:hypothetical protein